MPSWNQVARRIRVPLGFVFSALYLWMAQPSPTSLIIGVLLVVVGLSIRALASGHVQKNEQLAVSGPYAYSRNPLYLGSIILAIGFVCASRSWLIAAIAAAMFVAIYIPVIRSEEEFLRSRFPEFEEYSRAVPRLVPRLSPYQSSANSFSWHLYWKHREYNAAIGSTLLFVALIVKLLRVK